MSAIFVDSLKIFFKIFNLRFICHFNKHICCSLLEFTNTFVLSQSLKNLDVKLGTCSTLSPLFLIFDPIVFKGSLSSKPLFWIYNKELFDQIFGCIRNIVEFDVIKMEFAAFDLCKNFISILSLERKISTHKNIK